VVAIDSSNEAALAALAALITSPDNAYVNIHSTQFPGGVARSQMFPVVTTAAQAVGGGEWISSMTIRNPSNTSAVEGILDLFESSGALMPEAISDPNISFLIQPAGSVTFSTHNKGPLKAGFARIFSNGNLNVETRYLNASFTPAAGGAVTATSRAVSLPVAFGSTANQNTGISIVANAAGTVTLSLNQPNGVALVGAIRTFEVTAGQQITAFVKEVFPVVDPPQFAEFMNININTGTISVLGLQFDTGVTLVTVSAQP